MRRSVSAVALCVLTLFAAPHAAAAAPEGAVQASYRVLPVVKLTVTPNYQSGFGPAGTSGSGAGSGLTPAAGSTAVLGGGNVDFGTVAQGYQYLYRYAAQLNVSSNDTAGFTVFGEGSTDWNGATTGAYALANILFFLPSASSNTAFTPAIAFAKTAGTPTNGNQNISYAGAPPASATVWKYSGPASATQGYDYQMRVPASIPIDTFSVYVVYTVVGN